MKRFQRVLPHLACLLALALMGADASAQGFNNVPPFTKLGDLETCSQQWNRSENCLSRLSDYVRMHPEEELAAARLVRLNYRPHAALAFFEGPIERNEPGVCADKDLSLAVSAGLALPPDFPDAARARKIFAGKCRAALEPAIIAEVKSASGGYLQDNACPILAKNGKAPEVCTSRQQSAEPAPAADALPALDKGKVVLDAGRAYKGGEGEIVIMVPVKGGDLCLIHFVGIRGPWNGKTILHKREDRGGNGENYWTMHDGARWNTLVRNYQFEVFAPGYKAANGFSVYYSDDATNAINLQSILDAWKQ